MRRILCWLGWHEEPKGGASALLFQWEWACVHCRKPWMEW